MALAFLRQHKRWLYVFLWVVILSFVVLYIPQLDPQSKQMADDTLATVGGEPIRTREFQAAYAGQIQRFQSMMQRPLDEAMIEQFGIRDQALSALVSQRVIGLEANRLGIKIDDEAVARAVLQDPQLQTDKGFMGTAQMKRALQSQGRTLHDFEEDIRKQLQVEQFQTLITSSVQVSESEIEEEFRRRTDLVKAEYVVVDSSRFEAESQPTDAEVQARFEAKKEAYRLPERRRLSYILVDPSAFRTKVAVEGTEIESYYRNQKDEFSTPEQVCARHILVKVKASPDAAEGHSEAEARTIAEGLLARVKKGEAFDAVAKAKSEDSSASSGGSLGCFPRGQMVAAFEVAAFGLAPGAMSDLVRSDFGFHIIKVDSKTPPSTTPLEQARPRIQAILQDTKSREMASQVARSVDAAVKGGKTLEQIAADQSLTVAKSEPLTASKGMAPLLDPSLLAKAFELAKGETSKEAFQAAGGAVFVRLDEILAPKIPELSEVKEDVRRDALKSKVRDRARAVAERVASAAKTTGLQRAAAAEKLTRKESQGQLPRGQVFADIQGADAFEKKAFALSPGSIEAIETPTGFAVVNLLEKKTSDKSALDAQRDELRETIAQTRKQQLFQSYMQSIRDRYPVVRNDAAFARLR